MNVYLKLFIAITLFSLAIGAALFGGFIITAVLALTACAFIPSKAENTTP